MKKLFVGMFLLGGIAFSFAATEEGTRNAVKPIVLETIQSKINPPVKSTCTVRVITSSRDVTITITCTCTTGDACNQAYAIASLGL